MLDTDTDTISPDIDPHEPNIDLPEPDNDLPEPNNNPHTVVWSNNLHAVIEEEFDDDEGQINGHSLQADGFKSEDDLELVAHLDSDSDGLDEHITRGLAVEDLITEDFECEFAESGVYH